MPYKHKRDCPFCSKPGLRYMSDHLRQVHNLYGDERKKWLGRARFSAPHDHNSSQLATRPAQILKEMRCVQKKTSSALKLTRTVPKVTASLTTMPYPEFNFGHKFSLMVVGPSQSGKTYFVQQMLENNRIVYDEQRNIRILWCYNQWQDRYDDLKKSLGKSIRFRRGLPELSEDLSEIDTRYNNIIILDDLMAEATDSPVVARLFTQGRHRNASVILLLQNMFPKGKFNTDISRNAQYLALFRSPSDRKQIGIVGERMFDKNRIHFMNAYYKETEKPFGYLLVDNKPDTPADKQVLGDIFGDCHVYLFATQTKVSSTVEPTPVFAKPGRKQPKHSPYITWSDATIREWQNFTLGAQGIRDVPEGYTIVEMYKSSRNSVDPNRPGVCINDERYWPVKIRHQSTGRMKWVNLHEDEPTVRAFVKETLANEQ